MQLLDWLDQQEEYPKGYWSSRNGEDAVAWAGCKEKIEDLSQLKKKEKGVRYYGGIRFDRGVGALSKEWEAFGSCCFIRPKIERRASPFPCDNSFSSPFLPPPFYREDFPDEKGWQKNLEEAFRLFLNKEREKIVLARRASFFFEEPFSAVKLLHQLSLKLPGCFHFAFFPNADVAFFGATPELLYHRKGSWIESEAVAGTRRRGNNPDEDQLLGQELLNAKKDRREHAYVTEHIRACFEELCEESLVDPYPLLLRRNYWQHLWQRVRGRLKETFSDEEILTQLLPTPAVGGYPREGIEKEIARIEGFDRGWYAGAIGWLSDEESELAVAIRSGLAYKRSLLLYSGAGIVEDSSPKEEWQEIETKIQNLKHSIEAGCYEEKSQSPMGNFNR